MVHIWHEDSKDSSTTQFWNFLKKSNISILLNGADIEGFGGNDKLLDQLNDCEINDDDIYYIFLDCVYDNPSILDAIYELDDICTIHKNVISANILCFEYLILGFIDLEKWIGKQHNQTQQYLFKVRQEFIERAKSGESIHSNKTLVNYICKRRNISTDNADWLDRVSKVTSEQLATLILSDLTGGGPLGFRVTKTVFGLCWTCDCKDNCDHSVKNNHRNACKQCYLNQQKFKKTSQVKACDLWYGTDVHRILH